MLNIQHLLEKKPVAVKLFVQMWKASDLI